MINFRSIIKRFFPQILATLTVSVGILSDGMQFAWTSPMIPILQSKNSPIKVNWFSVMWLENIVFWGGFIGIPFTVWSIQNYGRKNSIRIASSLELLSWALIAIATNVETMLLARFIYGFASIVIFVSVPMYIAEISDKEIRGFLSSLTDVMLLCGILLVYCVGPCASILTTCIIGSSFNILQLVTISFIPASPYYLLIKKNKDQARKSIQWLQRDNSFIEEELEHLSEVVEQQQCEQSRFVDLIAVKSNRKATLIMMYLNALRQSLGIGAMILNLNTILHQSSANISASKASVLFSLVMLSTALIGSVSVDFLGRKILLMISSLIASISLLVLAVYFTVKGNNVNVVYYNWIPVAAVLVYAASYRLGLGIVPTVIMCELFPINVKTWGMVLGDAWVYIFSFCSLTMYNLLAHFYSIQAPLYVYAILGFLSLIMTFIYIPETKGRSLEEIQTVLKHEKFQESYKLNKYKTFITS